ncbi:MAG: type II toxin-antitoxin system HicB family antitoxin [Nostochopsis sp.]
MSSTLRAILMKSLQDYTIVTRPDDNSTFVAYVPAIPGCHAWGQTSDEARAELVYVFENDSGRIHRTRKSLTSCGK